MIVGCDATKSNISPRVESLGPLLALVASLNGLEVSRIALLATLQESDERLAIVTCAAVIACADRKEDWAAIAQGFMTLVGTKRPLGIPYPAELARSTIAAAAVQRALRAILCADLLEPDDVVFAVGPLVAALGERAVDDTIAKMRSLT